MNDVFCTCLWPQLYFHHKAISDFPREGVEGGDLGGSSSCLQSFFFLKKPLRPTSWETLDPQRAGFASRAQTSWCPVPSQPRRCRDCPWLQRRLGRTACPTHSSCRPAAAGPRSPHSLQTQFSHHVVALLQKQSIVSCIGESNAGGVSWGNAWLLRPRKWTFCLVFSPSLFLLLAAGEGSCYSAARLWRYVILGGTNKGKVPRPAAPWRNAN